MVSKWIGYIFEWIRVKVTFMLREKRSMLWNSHLLAFYQAYTSPLFRFIHFKSVGYLISVSKKNTKQMIHKNQIHLLLLVLYYWHKLGSKIWIMHWDIAVFSYEYRSFSIWNSMKIPPPASCMEYFVNSPLNPSIDRDVILWNEPTALAIYIDYLTLSIKTTTTCHSLKTLKLNTIV